MNELLMVNTGILTMSIIVGLANLLSFLFSSITVISPAIAPLSLPSSFSSLPSTLNFFCCLSHICCVILSLSSCSPAVLRSPSLSLSLSSRRVEETVDFACSKYTHYVWVSVCFLLWCHPGMDGRRKQCLLNHDFVATEEEG